MTTPALTARTLGLLHLHRAAGPLRVEHQNDLAFPFRRYQIQKVWRGNAAPGRLREFYRPIST